MFWFGLAILIVIVAVAIAVARGGSALPSRFPPGTLGFEAELSIGPFRLTIASRQQEMTAASPERRAELQAEIDFLCQQVDAIQAVIDRGDVSPGRGYVGFDAFGTTKSSWVPHS